MSSRLIIGCGYLGKRVAALWQQQGHHVFATTRTHLQDPALTSIVCDVLQPASLAGLPAVETVLYAVGFDRASGSSMRAVYVEGLDNVLRHLPRPGRFIHISSSSVYGQSDGSWVDEASPTEPAEESGRIVLEAEELL